MNSPIIIVKIINTLEPAIEYLEQSLQETSERYYPIKERDEEIAEANQNLSGLVAFVIFESETEKEYKISKIYIGNGKIVEDDIGWRINYKIEESFSSSMIINNFISNLELDLYNDFVMNSYIMIEDNKELAQQIRFIAFKPYEAESENIENQNYAECSKESLLHEFSQFNQHCKRPVGKLFSQEFRSEFQRDYERIVHAKAYRRLVDKAQIFTSSKGDHYRTRMTHTLEVTQIARAISLGLNLNTELTEAIALAHDLGHTPFGHQGERTIDDILKGKIDVISYNEQNHNFYGGFKHNFQGVRVVDYLEEKYIKFHGLDLSYQVLEGILKHTSVKIKNCNECGKNGSCDQKCFDLTEFVENADPKYLYLEYSFPTTLEGQIVAIADEVAQRSHDLDDAFASGTLSVEQLKDYLGLNKTRSLRDELQKIEDELREAKENNKVFISEGELKHGRIVSEIIKYFINDVIEQSIENINKFEKDDLYNSAHRFSKKLICFSQEGSILCDYLEKIISKKVISSTEVARFDNRGRIIVEALFRAYYNNPRLLHKGTLKRMYIEMREYADKVNVIDFIEGDRDEVNKEIERIVDRDLSQIDNLEEKEEYLYKKKVLVRAIADYISGMTDSYAVNEYNSLFG